MAEHAQYCIYAFCITKREGKICSIFKQKNGQTFFCCKVCVFCGYAMVEASLIIQDGEQELGVHGHVP